MARFGSEAVVLAARDPRVVAKQACTMTAARAVAGRRRGLHTARPALSPAVAAQPHVAFLAEQVNAYAELGADYVSVVPGYDEPSAAATIEALGRG